MREREASWNAIPFDHGSTNAFAAFDRRSCVTAAHIYLTDDPDVARRYGDLLYRVRASADRLLWLHPDDIGVAEADALHAAFEAIGADWSHESFADFVAVVTGADGQLYGVRGRQQDAVLDELFSLGFDAVAFPNGVPDSRGWAMSYVFADPARLVIEDVLPTGLSAA